MFKKNIKKLFFSLLSILILSMSVFFGANACATQERINIEGPQLLTGKLLEDGEYFYNAKYMSSGDSVENSTWTTDSQCPYWIKIDSIKGDLTWSAADVSQYSQAKTYNFTIFCTSVLGNISIVGNIDITVVISECDAVSISIQGPNSIATTDDYENGSVDYSAIVYPAQQTCQDVSWQIKRQDPGMDWIIGINFNTGVLSWTSSFQTIDHEYSLTITATSVNFPLISEDLEITFSNSFAQPISIEINGPQTVNAKFHTPYFVKYNASVLDSLSQERPRQNVLWTIGGTDFDPNIFEIDPTSGTITWNLLLGGETLDTYIYDYSLTINVRSLDIGPDDQNPWPIVNVSMQITIHIIYDPPTKIIIKENGLFFQNKISGDLARHYDITVVPLAANQNIIFEYSQKPGVWNLQIDEFGVIRWTNIPSGSPQVGTVTLRTTTQDNPVGSSQPLSLEMTSIYYFFNPPTPTFYTNQVNVNSEYKAKRMNFQTSNISLTANDGLLPGSTNDDGGETYCDVGYIDNEISPNDILSYEWFLTQTSGTTEYDNEIFFAAKVKSDQNISSSVEERPDNFRNDTKEATFFAQAPTTGKEQYDYVKYSISPIEDPNDNNKKTKCTLDIKNMQIINPNMSDGGSSSNNLKVYRVYPVCTGFNSSAELHCRISFYNSSQQLTTKDTKISVQINPGSWGYTYNNSYSDKATLWNDRVTFYTYGMRPINDIGTTTTYQSLGAFWTYKDDYYSDDRNDQWNKYNNSYERTQNALTFSDPQSGVVQGNAYMTFTNDSGDQTFHAKSSYAVIPSGFDRSTHYWTWNNHFQPA